MKALEIWGLHVNIPDSDVRSYSNEARLKVIVLEGSF